MAFLSGLPVVLSLTVTISNELLAGPETFSNLSSKDAPGHLDQRTGHLHY